MKPAALILASSAASRIGQLVRLLASDRPGEVVAAAAAIKRTLAGAGTDLHHLADVAETALQHAPQIAPRLDAADDDDVGAMVRFCFDRTDFLSEREAGFIRNMHHRLRLAGDNFEPSERQLAWLLGIYQRLRS